MDNNSNHNIPPYLPESQSFEAIYQKNLRISGKDATLLEAESLNSIVNCNMDLATQMNTTPGTSLTFEVEKNSEILRRTRANTDEIVICKKTSSKPSKAKLISPNKTQRPRKASTSSTTITTNLLKTGSSLSVRNLASLFEKAENKDVFKPHKVTPINTPNIKKVETNEPIIYTDVKVKDRISDLNLKIESQLSKHNKPPIDMARERKFSARSEIKRVTSEPKLAMSGTPAYFKKIETAENTPRK